MFGLKGPNLTMVTACSTATHAIGDAARYVEYGDADAMVAGAAEAAVTPTSLAGFGNAKALSTRNDDPQGASRPWDRERDGFVLSEGAGVVVLEELEHARKRGARIYAELAGFGLSDDAYHMTSPPEDGEGASRCMQNALRNAAINAEQVDYVNAHGTSTPLGDLAETIALKSTFGEHAYKLAVSSTKSMTGHLLGAAGGVEAVYTVLTIHHQLLPPTINLENPDPQCDLDYVPGSAREMAVQVALSNSFGFGGTNGTLVFRRLGD
jgi:3-oxoacyl-[acyl-carrier-protein] synthase II